MKKKTGWKTTKPPKRKTIPIKLRYQDSDSKIYTGNFVWSDSQDTWLSHPVDPEYGLYLHERFGYKVLGWK